jgi:DNA-binding transcriptional LysR family regulator
VDNLSALNVFVRVGEASSFTAAGKQLGVSASAVSKAIGRLEERLGVRLFHRSTRMVSLTPEGVLFLERCRHILSQVESAEAELLHAQGAPRGRLRISVPSVGSMFMSRLAEFKRLYPDIALEVDCSDRFVDVIEEGFDTVIRTGQLTDSRLTARRIGACRKIVVGAPDYLKRAGMPRKPADLLKHDCLVYRYPNTGKLDLWPWDGALHEVPASAIANTLEPQVCLAERGAGLAYVPDIAVRQQLESGRLVAVLDKQVTQELVFYVLWPSSRHLPSKIRVFVDFIAEKLFPL